MFQLKVSSSVSRSYLFMLY